MKNKGKTILMSLIIFFTIGYISTEKTSAQGYGQVSFDIFYNELSPYGFWDNDSQYGDIWFPSVEQGFRPYGSNGHWTMTQYGNTWVSNYPWGWATFHYGRWIYSNNRGWGWIPGYEWGPAWVDWRSGNGYYGWAPMAPRLSINISIGLPLNLWVFAPSRRIYDRNIYRHSHHGRPNIYNNTTIINNTYIVNNNHYYGGPSRRDVERSTGKRVTVRDVRSSERPGASIENRQSVSIYRPDRNTKQDNNISSNRNNNLDRNPRTNNSISSRSDGNTRITREMHIDKDGNNTIQERNNRLSNNQINRDNSSTQQNRNNERSSRSQPSTQNRVHTRTAESSRQSSNEIQQPEVKQREARVQSDSNRSGAKSRVERQASRIDKNTRQNTTTIPTRVERSNSSSSRSNTTTSARGNSERTSARTSAERSTSRGTR